MLSFKENELDDIEKKVAQNAAFDRPCPLIERSVKQASDEEQAQKRKAADPGEVHENEEDRPDADRATGGKRRLSKPQIHLSLDKAAEKGFLRNRHQKQVNSQPRKEAQR